MRARRLLTANGNEPEGRPEASADKRTVMHRTFIPADELRSGHAPRHLQAARMKTFLRVAAHLAAQLPINEDVPVQIWTGTRSILDDAGGFGGLEVEVIASYPLAYQDSEPAPVQLPELPSIASRRTP